MANEENAICVDFTSASVGAGTESELIASQPWSQIPIDSIAVLTELGVFGDSTAGTVFRLNAGQREIKQRGPPNYTSFNRDYLFSLQEILYGGEVLRLYVYNAAGGAQTYRIQMKFTVIK